MTFKLAATLCMSTALLSPTFAAENYDKDASIYNWTGFYGGFNVGAVKSTMDITDVQATTFYATIQQASHPQMTGGLQFGYRRQVDMNTMSGVFGLELSGNYANARFDQEYGSSLALYQLEIANALKMQYLLQAIGGIAVNRTLLFVAGGLSWSHFTGCVSNLDSLPFFDSFSLNKKPTGIALGGGLEYAVSEKLSARFKLDVITPNVYTVYNNTGNNFQIANSVVQGSFGLNLKLA